MCLSLSIPKHIHATEHLILSQSPLVLVLLNPQPSRIVPAGRVSAWDLSRRSASSLRFWRVPAFTPPPCKIST